VGSIEDLGGLLVFEARGRERQAKQRNTRLKLLLRGVAERMIFTYIILACTNRGYIVRWFLPEACEPGSRLRAVGSSESSSSPPLEMMAARSRLQAADVIRLREPVFRVLVEIGVCATMAFFETASSGPGTSGLTD
jgi:hypothetical protein